MVICISSRDLSSGNMTQITRTWRVAILGTCLQPGKMFRVMLMLLCSGAMGRHISSSQASTGDLMMTLGLWIETILPFQGMLGSGGLDVLKEEEVDHSIH